MERNLPRFFSLRGRRLEIFGRGVTLPASRAARIAIGILFIIGGCFAFLPILGVWMIPLGLMILSMDIAFVRRGRRRTAVRWARWRAERRRRAEAKLAVPPAPVAPRPAARPSIEA
ncbi:hypothetical protein GCM10011390_07790 [Aureimonas endophytica]|uniref:Uncharacterized protein n=1 Tax=Aureimonas endophytica TaxID=2027858 RepID=A0A917E0J7_9HYPH|nr:hypothetical protein [Aureimonas endophytica]GGD91461.1 hypothetical protein GCM10011390_07790 [Aureimonas endophytica]